MHAPDGTRVRAARRRRLGAAAALAVAAAACGGVLDVKNPNNVVEEALDNPAAATAITNGSGGAVTRALSAILAPYSTVTDELTYVGSRDAYGYLDRGEIADPFNEFSDAAYFYVAEARWTAARAIERVVAFDKANQLATRNDLARAYLYGAVIYTTIPDLFDDFVITSDRTTPGNPVGEANMAALYDTAVTHATSGLAATTDNTLRAQLTAMRARARFAKAVWAKVNPPGQAVTQPLVNDAAAVADARAALALMAGNDFAFRLTPLTQTLGFPIIGNDLNNRLELRAGDAATIGSQCRDATCDRYIVPNTAGNLVASTKYADPITGQPDPVYRAAITSCCIKGPQNGAGDLVPMTIVSAREMHLILAEAALAQNNLTEFATNINAIRAFNQLAPWTSGGAVTPLQILQHTRFSSLFLQGRRLADMYRFGLRAAVWPSTAQAARRFCFLPITVSERQSNPNVTAQPACVGG